MSSCCSESKNFDDLTPEQIFIAFSNLTSQNVEPCCEHILDHYNAINKKLGMTGLSGLNYYRKLKSHIVNNLRAKAIWEILDKRSANSSYNKQKTCKNYRIAIIGAGPVGLRMAIEGLLLGAEVHVIEKRTSFTRNNVAHLWHFTIEDFKMLGVKKLYGGFCAGNINHISIRRIQCIFLQISLMLGVQFHAPLEYVDITEPDEEGKHKWRLKLDQPDHPVANVDFDFIVAADGARTSFRSLISHNIKPGKLCLGITANFVNTRSQKEMEVQSIAGVAAIYDQQFFRSLKSEKDIELENIVYYKDDTHYFVMTARKKNLLAKKVLNSDGKELGDLCRRENINYEMLIKYVRDVNDFATGLELDFYIKKDKRPDVSLFDFSRRAVSTNACKMYQRHGATMTVLLIGDSLIEPFWPLGTGLALGVLTVLDTAWFIKGFAEGVMTPLELISYRECLFKLLNSEFNSNNLLKPFSNYTIDPTTRYPNFQLPTKISQEIQQKYKFLYVKDIGSKWQGIHTASTTALNLDPNNVVNTQAFNKEKPRNIQDELQSRFKDKPAQKKNINVGNDQIAQMQHWFKEVLSQSQILVDKTNFWATFKDGNAFAFIISKYRPELLDMKEVSGLNTLERLERVFKIADEDFGISPMFKPSKFLFHPDQLEVIYYLLQWYNFFKHESMNSKSTLRFSRIYSKLTFKRKHGGTKRDSKARGDASKLFQKAQDNTDSICRKCDTFIYTTEKVSAEGTFFHRRCFTCEFSNCNTQLTSNNCSVYHNEDHTITFLCPYHFNSIQSADFATGCNTLKHVKDMAHLTTEQIASKASEVRDRAITVDDAAPAIPIKQVQPILSNMPSKKERSTTQPLLDSPVSHSKSVSQEFNGESRLPTVNSSIPKSESQKHITETPKSPVFSPSPTNGLQQPTVNSQKPINSPDTTVPYLPAKPSKYDIKVTDPQAALRSPAKKLLANLSPTHPYNQARKLSEVASSDSPPVLPKFVSNDILSSPGEDTTVTTPISPPELLQHELQDAVRLRTHTQPNTNPHKKSSYCPNPNRQHRYVTNNLSEQFPMDEDTAFISNTTPRNRLSNYPSNSHKTSMVDLLSSREENDDVGPNVQVFHRYNIFKAQSSESLLRGSFNLTNEHFNPRAATKHKRRYTEDQMVLRDNVKRLSQVKESIENHPLSSRNSIEVQALKAEQIFLEKTIAKERHLSLQSQTNNKEIPQKQQQNTAILKHGSVLEVKIEPETCEYESVDCETPRTEHTRSLCTPPKEHYRIRLSAHSGQNSLYRSKRYRSTRVTNIQTPQKPVVHTDSFGPGQSSDDENDFDAVQAQNQKEQDAFRRAIELDEEMDLVQQKILVLEERGKYYESKIRNIDDANDENMVRYLKDWSDIIESKNELVRVDRDLSLEFKELQLKDELFRVENELRKKEITDTKFKGVESKALINEKMTIVEEMDELVAQIDRERINELEEDEYRNSKLPHAIQTFTGIMSDAIFVENPKGNRSRLSKYKDY
ncbi:Protein-methionine sulfoxide oxidase MICAL2 isoform X14 [Oopsacas minuta]|uniref:F-actin monooxygenase n=1 Tax=Oopsacas minuta TaxID=111878 RepID=A0AAV7JU85_9METZ|nr:Protein-methionine sulfoxide oxidase MICAL2 isoform X14 [Oopsacas minuta]